MQISGKVCLQTLQGCHSAQIDDHTPAIWLKAEQTEGTQTSWPSCGKYALFSPLSIERVMQIRAGTGGDEAALFAADLLRMYERYADEQSWKVNHLSESLAENGGLKEAIVQVSYIPGQV